MCAGAKKNGSLFQGEAAVVPVKQPAQPSKPGNGVRATFTDSILEKTHQSHMSNRVPDRADQSEMIFDNTFNEDFTS